MNSTECRKTARGMIRSLLFAKSSWRAILSLAHIKACVTFNKTIFKGSVLDQWMFSKQISCHLVCAAAPIDWRLPSLLETVIQYSCLPVMVYAAQFLVKLSSRVFEILMETNQRPRDWQSRAAAATNGASFIHTRRCSPSKEPQLIIVWWRSCGKMLLTLLQLEPCQLFLFKRRNSYWTLRTSTEV